MRITNTFYKIDGFQTLFLEQRFRPHRLIGFTFLAQYFVVVYLYLFKYEKFLRSPLLVTLPLTGLMQSINAALTFTFLPKKEDSGFAAVSDKAVLSYYTVVESKLSST